MKATDAFNRFSGTKKGERKDLNNPDAKHRLQTEQPEANEIEDLRKDESALVRNDSVGSLNIINLGGKVDKHSLCPETNAQMK